MCVDKKNSSLFKCVRVSCEVVFVSKEIQSFVGGTYKEKYKI